MPFYNDGITIISLTTIILACLIMTLKLIFNLKCNQVKCCGCIITRQVELEVNNEI